MVPPASHRVSRVRRYSGARRRGPRIRVRGSNPVPPAFPCRSASSVLCNRAVPGPTTPAGLALPPVWPRPLSLAATGGVSFDFSSSGYLDVSVPRVASPRAMRSPGGVTRNDSRRVFPFGDPRVDGLVPLTADYRSLTRPSSASSAKASTVRPYHLPYRQDGGSSHIHRTDAIMLENLVATLCGSPGAVGGRALGTGRRDLAMRTSVIGKWSGRAAP